MQRPLPVADLIGLRFSVLHLRLVGYGLLAAWLCEMVNLITAQDLLQLGPRLHYISQFIDLSPLLLVALGLIAVQGGLRRSWMERGLLPLLFALLPLVTALVLLLAPISIANAVTLADLQQNRDSARLEQAERQLDTVRRTVVQGASLQQLSQRLQSIPGLRLQLPASATLPQARREALQSIDRERSRLRRQLRFSGSSSHQALLRRALLNAAQALVLGAVVWAIHARAVQEMEQAIPFLEWALGATQPDDQVAVLQDLLRFQRRCVALSPMALVELLARLLERRLGGRREPREEEETLVLNADDPPVYPPEPFPGPVQPLWLRGRGFGGLLGGGGYGPPPQSGYAPLPEDEDPAPDPGAPEPQVARSLRQQRLQALQRQQARLGWQRLGEEASYQEAEGVQEVQPPRPLSRAELRRQQLDRQRGRLALQRFGDYLMDSQVEPQDQLEALPPTAQGPSPPGPPPTPGEPPSLPSRAGEGSEERQEASLRERPWGPARLLRGVLRRWG